MGFRLLQKEMDENFGIKYDQKLLDSATDAMKTASKRAIQKTAEATGDLVGNKIADKITSVSKKNLQRSCAQSCTHKIIKLMMNGKHQKKDTYLQIKGNKLLMK